jgi:predicted anti-sigma-YlaC factor YlaD
MDYLEGNLDAGTRTKLDEHLRACPPCVNFLKGYRTCAEMAQELRDQKAQIPIELEARLKSFLRQEIDSE